MKVFLSVSYSSRVDSSGNVLPAYRKELEVVISMFEDMHHAVYCAPREDDWTLSDTSPAEAFNIDMRHVDECDLFIAFIGNTISAGIQMEIGFALAKGKRVIVTLPDEDKLGYVNQGLIDSNKGELLRYSDQSDLLEKLSSLVSAFQPYKS